MGGSHDGRRRRPSGNKSNPQLVRAWRAAGIDAVELSPPEAFTKLGPGDVALVRLDVLQTLDGVEPGMPLMYALELRGVRVLNPPQVLLRVHDKLETARWLQAAEIPHPRTTYADLVRGPVGVQPPVVVKPRFGSWGRDVFLCETRGVLRHCLAELRDRPWFRKNGALVQELVPLSRQDLRVVVAAGRVVGAARRQAAPGEWRTNVSLGGALLAADPSPAAIALAVRAAGVVEADLVGVDLLPLPDGSHVVLELNGAVDFDGRYSLGGGDAYLDAAAALGLCPAPQSVEMSATSAAEMRSKSVVRILSE